MLRRFLPDPFILALVSTAILAVILPVRGWPADVLSVTTMLGVALVFFLHGARLVTANVLEGLSHWRIHVTILLCTFLLFPFLALPFWLLVPSILSPDLYTGFLFLSILPSTIQSSISFTSIAGGNVPAAVCSASASNMLGVVLTPLLASLLLHTTGVIDAHAIQSIAMQLLLPFLAGQLVQRWVGDWLRANRRLLGLVERGSMLLVVLGAFSSATLGGVWTRLGPLDFVLMIGIVAALLCGILLLTRTIGHRFGFSRQDEIAIMFCGSKKSIGSGLPMANIIFAGQALGMIALPMIVYHQLQLMVCAFIAARYEREAKDARGEEDITSAASTHH